MKTASWVIVSLTTGQVVYETFNPVFVRKLNTQKYKAVPIMEWLQSINNAA